ncbi:MAG: ribbon-helix-helix protein, CopG family [Pirellulales bacterium]|nr:ribbon-helix-helix protein, CopG family [Pirellulales bacterium]
MKTISLKVPKPLDVQLSRAARKLHVSKSAVLRRLLENYLDSKSSPISGSCFEQSSDLAGCVHGPGDLSFNKKHLEGFGK